jgi:hypothetical protein
MGFARVLTAAAGCVVLVAAIAACSGSFGSGSNSPIPLGSLGPGGAPTSTPASTSSSVILTYGDSDAFQSLPDVGGFSGSIAFPKAPPPTPAPSAKPGKGGASATPVPAPTPVSVAIGATLYTSKPDDGPDLNFESGKGHARRSREKPARALAYIKLLPTHDVTFESYPKISVDIPRDLAAQYRDGEFGIALWNAGEKDTRYRLAVAQRDVTSSSPPIAQVSHAPVPSVSAVATGVPLPVPSPSSADAGKIRFGGEGGGAAGGGASGASLAPGAAPSATLPPQRLLFAGTATTFHLLANQPAIFALYALPHPAAQGAASASPVPQRAGSAHLASPAPPAAPAASGVPTVIPSALPAPELSSTPGTTLTAAPSASPALTTPHR